MAATATHNSTFHDSVELDPNSITPLLMSELETFDASRVEVVPVEPVDSKFQRFGGRCILLKKLFSKEECKRIIQISAPFLEPVEQHFLGRATRVSDRFNLHSPQLAECLWQRLKQSCDGLQLYVDPDPTKQRLLSAQEGECPEELYVGYFKEGIWHPTSVSPRVGFHRYRPGGFFRRHQDAPLEISEDEQSFYSALLYLDDDMQGGSTKFLSLDAAEVSKDNFAAGASAEAVLATVSPECGACLIFFQPGLVHEGEDLLAGEKHFIRLDIVFKRDPATKLAYSATEAEAIECIRQAQKAEEARQFELSCKLYRRAFKLYPKLEKMF